jgi:MFS family permease
VTKVGLAVHRTFHSLHSRNFRLFFVGQAVSVTGTWMQAVAAAWLVLQLTGSGVALGIETALTFAPILFIGGWAGGMADRHDKRTILIATQIAFAVLALALWGTVATGVVELWMVYALSFLQGVVTAVDTPTRQSFYVEMVGPKDLTNAVSLNSAVMTGTRIIGPALAGVLIAGVGLAWCFFLNGVSYIAVIGGLYAMRVRDLHRREAPSDGGRFREGLRYAWSTPELRSPLLLMAVLFTFSFNFSVLLPLLAEGTFHGDAGTYGLLLSLMGAGSLVGALAMARRNTPSPKRLALWAIGFGLVSALSAMAPSLDAEMVVLVPLGLVAIAFMITANSTLQLTSRPEMRGRVMALYSVVFLGGTPIGAPIAGFIGEHLGPRVGIAIGAMTAIAAGAIGLRALSRLGTPSALGADPELVATPAAAALTEPDLAVDEALTA